VSVLRTAFAVMDVLADSAGGKVFRFPEQIPESSFRPPRDESAAPPGRSRRCELVHESETPTCRGRWSILWRKSPRFWSADVRAERERSSQR
jgi:hypothetical protein